MKLFIGIDPSLNSTGLCFQTYDDNENKIYEKFFIIKPEKLTKKEQKAQDENDNFEYVIYPKTDLSEYNDNNHLHEYHKTLNMISLIDAIYNTIINVMQQYIDDEYFESFIVMEGISYGSSIRTKSVFDLAGLNYLIRYKLIKVFNHTKFTIVPPSELKKFTTGKGNANKDTIVTLFQLLYPNLTLPKLDDIADAYFMATYAIHMDKYNEI
jgi:Holliday junction resolvasome RuvABC endonuclease subunit